MAELALADIEGREPEQFALDYIETVTTKGSSDE